MSALRPSVGLLGRIFAILLLAVGIELAVSTLLYERASELRVAEEEAHRLADLLEQTNRLMNNLPPAERNELAARLSTDKFVVRWHPAPMPEIPNSEALNRMREQVLHWEPELAESDIAFQLKSADGLVRGQFQLDDESWVEFRVAQIVESATPRFTRMLLALVPAIALVLIGGLLLRQMLAPLRMLSAAAGRIGGGERIRLPESGVGEIGRVVVAFNDMQERIHRLIADRVEALASMGHDLRTPLARMQLRLDGVEDSDTRNALEQDVHEMEAMISSLLAYLGGDSDPEKRVSADIAVIAQTVVDAAADAGGDAHYTGPDHLETPVRPLAFKRALTNLVENGIKYADGVRVFLSREAGDILLIVEDEGAGIPDHELEHVLEPFVRLDLARARNTDGMGLGIPMAHKVVLREGGSFRLSNRPDGGLRVEIRLPAA